MVALPAVRVAVVVCLSRTAIVSVGVLPVGSRCVQLCERGSGVWRQGGSGGGGAGGRGGEDRGLSADSVWHRERLAVSRGEWDAM